MAEIINSKRYDLEDRTLKYARDAISLINGTPDTLANRERYLNNSSGRPALSELIILRLMELSVKKILLCELESAVKKPKKVNSG